VSLAKVTLWQVGIGVILVIGFSLYKLILTKNNNPGFYPILYIYGGSLIFILVHYFLAKKSFWMAWLELGDFLFEEAENQHSALGKKLCDTTTYGVQSLPMKIFVQERLATICLLANKNFSCLSYSPFNLGSSTTPFNQFMRESVISDALKIAYVQTQEQGYLREFSTLRNEIIESLQKPKEVLI
jgi:hypothetical protein